jgi:hypothetical protein
MQLIHPRNHDLVHNAIYSSTHPSTIYSIQRSSITKSIQVSPNWRIFLLKKKKEKEKN